MNVFSKFAIDNKFLDIQAGEYNLGSVPNMLIDKMVHEIRFANVLNEMEYSEIYDMIQDKNEAFCYYWSNWFWGDYDNQEDVEKFEKQYYNFAKTIFRA